MAAFLFDLDMTLLNTSALDAWRHLKFWKCVMANLDRVTTFPQKPHEIPSKLKKRGHQVAVITASPGDYATALLKHFEIAYDILIAYHDTERHKPDPEPIEAALKKLGVAAGNAYHIGDNPNDAEASYHAGVTSIGAGWGVTNWPSFSSSASDILLFDPKLLLMEELFCRLRYVGEVTGDKRPYWHDGSLLPLGEPSGYALGRYFATSDTRHSESELSQLILSFKDTDSPAEKFASLVALSIKKHDAFKEHRSVTCVPPKPKQANRFSTMSEYLAELVSDKINFNPNGLKCIRNVGELKGLNAADRQAAVRKTFGCNIDFQDQRVVLIDDVLTTSSTVCECASTLEKKGASQITCLVFGRDQYPFARKVCPECGLKMVVRKNSNTNERFWGCSGYSNCGCRHTESL